MIRDLFNNKFDLPEKYDYSSYSKGKALFTLVNMLTDYNVTIRNVNTIKSLIDKIESEQMFYLYKNCLSIVLRHRDTFNIDELINDLELLKMIEPKPDTLLLEQPITLLVCMLNKYDNGKYYIHNLKKQFEKEIAQFNKEYLLEQIEDNLNMYIPVNKNTLFNKYYTVKYDNVTGTGITAILEYLPTFINNDNINGFDCLGNNLEMTTVYQDIVNLICSDHCSRYLTHVYINYLKYAIFNSHKSIVPLRLFYYVLLFDKYNFNLNNRNVFLTNKNYDNLGHIILTRFYSADMTSQLYFMLEDCHSDFSLFVIDYLKLALLYKVEGISSMYVTLFKTIEELLSMGKLSEDIILELVTLNNRILKYGIISTDFETNVNAEYISMIIDYSNKFYEDYDNKVKDYLNKMYMSDEVTDYNVKSLKILSLLALDDEAEECTLERYADGIKSFEDFKDNLFEYVLYDLAYLNLNNSYSIDSACDDIQLYIDSIKYAFEYYFIDIEVLYNKYKDITNCKCCLCHAILHDISEKNKQYLFALYMKYREYKFGTSIVQS